MMAGTGWSKAQRDKFARTMARKRQQRTAYEPDSAPPPGGEGNGSAPAVARQPLRERLVAVDEHAPTEDRALMLVHAMEDLRLRDLEALASSPELLARFHHLLDNVRRFLSTAAQGVGVEAP